MVGLILVHTTGRVPGITAVPGPDKVYSIPSQAAAWDTFNLRTQNYQTSKNVFIPVGVEFFRTIERV